MKTILVTGGAGYVGSQTCKQLSLSGYTPIVLDNLSRGHRDHVKWGPLEFGDVTDGAFVQDVLSKWNPDAVIHLAALAYPGESMNDPASYYSNNLCGTLTILEKMAEANIEHLVFSSSCAVYGRPPHLPVTEETPLDPISPYGNSKLAAERMIEDFANTGSPRYVALRYFNVAGADPDGEVGEVHDPEPHLIPNALRAAYNGDQPLPIFGTDHPTRDGTCVRDFVHVYDIASAHILALQYLFANGVSQQYVLGSERGYSVREVIQIVEMVTGRSIPTMEVDRRDGDPPELYCISEKAKQDISWQPKYPDLESIIRHALKWFERVA